jgi:hypothetical protein
MMFLLPSKTRGDALRGRRTVETSALSLLFLQRYAPGWHGPDLAKSSRAEARRVCRPLPFHPANARVRKSRDLTPTTSTMAEPAALAVPTPDGAPAEAPSEAPTAQLDPEIQETDEQGEQDPDEQATSEQADTVEEAPAGTEAPTHSTGRPKGSKRKHLTRDERHRIRTLHTDAHMTTAEIIKATGFTANQIRTAIKAPSAEVPVRTGRPPKVVDGVRVNPVRPRRQDLKAARQILRAAKKAEPKAPGGALPQLPLPNLPKLSKTLKERKRQEAGQKSRPMPPETPQALPQHEEALLQLQQHLQPQPEPQDQRQDEVTEGQYQLGLPPVPPQQTQEAHAAEEWSTYDLTPSEALWGWMRDYIHRRWGFGGRPDPESLRSYMKDVLDYVPEQYLADLAASFPDRSFGA